VDIEWQISQTVGQLSGDPENSAILDLFNMLVGLRKDLASAVEELHLRKRLCPCLRDAQAKLSFLSQEEIVVISFCQSTPS